MPHVELPDVLGWELPRAQEELRALGISVSICTTMPPAWHRARAEAGAANTGVDLSAEMAEATWRVVATRPGRSGEVTLVVCAENW